MPAASTALAFALALATATPSAFACLACGCTLNADWASQGLSNQSGWSLDLRHDFVNQDDLRSGTRSVDRGAIAFPNDEEIQQKTVNRFTTLTVDDGFAEDWGLTLQVPWIDRYHTTIAGGDTAVSTSDFHQLGDARAMLRYTGFARASDWGLQVGLKLPTGQSGENFVAGPQTGQPLDRGLQPGTGSTDLVLGAFRFGTVGDPKTSAVEWFGNAQAQFPIAHDHAFRPGNVYSLSAGLRYAGLSTVSPQAQINVRFDGRESGSASDAPNSGSTLVDFSPGASWAATPRLSLYAFAQVPVYQRVNGLQLEPRWSLSAGAHVTF
jgi:hypothetical protein